MRDGTMTQGSSYLGTNPSSFLINTVIKKKQDRQRTHNVILRHVCVTKGRGKAISITYYESVCVASVIQHAKHMRRVMFSSVASLDSPLFRHYVTNGTIFGENVVEHKTCVLIFSTTFVRNIFHSKKNSASYHRKCT
jgi:hypothetical protein